MFDIQENLKNLPDKPGVYIHKDKLGDIIYVGKAVSLKNRVRQYFQSSKNMPPKVRSMVSQIAEFEYITAGSEMEALILECNLIKKYRPKYNVLLRDDKTYPYIKITNEEYPRILKTRIIKKDGGKYFGPYSDAGAVNRIVDLLNSSLVLKRCSAISFPKGYRPCLNYHINQCRGICNGDVDKTAYVESIEEAKDFLNGKNKAVITRLKSRMTAAAEHMEYEEAARCRDYIEAAEALSETQRVVIRQSKDMDIVIPARGTEETHMVIFFVREGKLTGRESYEVETYGTEDSGELISSFIKQHYSRLSNFPKEILMTRLPDDSDVLGEYLSELAGHNVRLVKPQKGEKKALIDMAGRDVIEMVKTIDDKAANERERRRKLGGALFDILQNAGMASGEYNGRDMRIEAYDISNTNGVDTVGAMVVFEGLNPDRKSYRKFKVRSVAGQDDYGSMREILFRRFRRVFQGDSSFEVLPDMILMDGGRGHVSAALDVIKETGFNIPVLGMVKDDRHRTRALVCKNKDGDDYIEIPLKDKPMLFRYIGNIQEEVHRFAIEYHRKLRSKSVSRSVLDEIEGIGPVRKSALLDHFRSVEAIKKASVDELEKAPNMNRKAAEAVWRYFNVDKTET